ncbi:iron complex transport system substrate-binding protein [Geothermobacter ehrlichii]|uniref:Iron complex transport system substrate-binding protein n=1 Tax=Geothermobacter ehrlichii TaxID=213224 RepID=A0A5D3WLF3_9BACT|nr:ABC transporter substrate-binding protein [Geothermobacter ehrlichii]TYO99267.1 iron complex transport system substrate-binding protein [Geothermobacter ehrlichii]
MFRLLLVLLLFCFSTEAAAAKRIVLLAPAAGDILLKLGAEDQVVGVTRSLREFPRARRVGSHIRPNLEIIRSLAPDLLIISSNRFFSEQMAAVVGAPVFTYHPRTLDEILQQIGELAALLDKMDAGRQLIARQQQKLAAIKPLATSPKVIFEVTAMPLMVAGSSNIVADIVARAGGVLLAPGRRKLVRFNPESVLAHQPDIYIYQVGPMNQNPIPPGKRGPLNRLRARFLRVDELQFSRANTRSFDNVLMLNRYFREANNG